MSRTYQLRWMSFLNIWDGVIAQGHVYGNPRFPDGYHVYTSVLKGLSLEGATLTIQTRNSHYSCPLEELCANQEEEDHIRGLLLEQLPQHQEILSKLVFHRLEDCPLPNENAKLRRLTDQTFSAIASQLSTLTALPGNCYVLCVNLQCSSNYLFSGFFKKKLTARCICF